MLCGPEEGMSPNVYLPPLPATPIAISWVRVLSTAPGLLLDLLSKCSSSIFLPREGSRSSPIPMAGLAKSLSNSWGSEASPEFGDSEILPKFRE